MELYTSSLEDWKNKHNRRCFEWTILRNKFRDLDITKCYEIYKRRMENTNLSLLFLIFLIIVPAHGLIICLSPHSNVDILFYFICTMASMYILSLNFNKICRVKFKTTLLYTPYLAVFLILIMDIMVVHMQYAQNKFIVYSYDLILLLCIYLFVPISGIVRPLLVGITVSCIYIWHGHFIKDVKAKNTRFNKTHIALVYIYMNILGFYFRLCSDYAMRVMILHGREFKQAQLVHKMITGNEKMMYKTIFPTSTKSNIKKDLTLRIFRYNMQQSGYKIKHTLHLEPYSNVTILCANLFNYRQLTKRLSVENLISFLQTIINRIESLAKEHNVTCINFSSENYCCAAGIPHPNAKHAECCVDLGLQMINALKEISEELLDVNIKLRIGINSGSVVGAIIGLSKWQFVIWSNDVSIAQQLMTTCRAGDVHVSAKTFSKLKPNYNYSIGIIESMESYLFWNKHPVRIEKETTYEEIQAEEETHFNYLPSITLDEYIRTSHPKEAINEILMKQVKTMPTGCIQYARIFNFSKDTFGLSEDLKFATNLTSIWLNLRNSVEELRSINEPDYLFPYSIFLTMLGFIFLIIGDIIRSFNAFRVSVILVHIILWNIGLISLYKKIWIMIISNTNLMKPTNGLSFVIYRISNSLQELFVARIFLYVVIVAGMLTLNTYGVFICVVGKFELYTVLSQLNTKYKASPCFSPWTVTYDDIFILSFSFLFMKMPYGVKFFTGVIILFNCGIRVLYNFDFTYNRSDSINLGVPPEVSHIGKVISTFLILVLKARQTCYLEKYDYTTLKKALKRRKLTKHCFLSIQTIIVNILPKCVLNRFIETQNKGEIIYNELNNVAVLYATIRNYDAQRMGLRVLDEIVCSFDEILNSYKSGHNIEKIKLSGWTYVVVCGLKTESETESEYLVRVSPTPSFKAAKATAQKIPKYKQNIELKGDENDNVLILTQFSLEILHAMQKIRNYYKFSSSLSSFNGDLSIGISYGKITGGIINFSKPIYDIWGDTVNMAKSLDELSPPGSISIDERSANILQQYGIKCRKWTEIMAPNNVVVPVYNVKENDTISIRHDNTGTGLLDTMSEFQFF